MVAALRSQDSLSFENASYPSYLPRLCWNVASKSGPFIMQTESLIVLWQCLWYSLSDLDSKLNYAAIWVLSIELVTSFASISASSQATNKKDFKPHTVLYD